MRYPVYAFLVALAVSVCAVGLARGAVTAPPSLALPAFTKAIPAGNGEAFVFFRWGAATFSPSSNSDRYEIDASDLTAGGVPLTTISVGGSQPQGFESNLAEGHQFVFTIIACQMPSACALVNPSTSAGGQTRVDATPPSGTVQINAGAPATNSRDVTLNLAATDPLINGIPGSSSGVTQVAVDNDGDGTYPCSFLILPGVTGDTSGCAGDFAPAVPATVTAGDGVKTVAVTFGDGAREIPAPCPPTCILLVGSPILGNASAPATDTIILDTVKPVALVTQDRLAVERGGAVSFDAGPSVDQNPAIASGVDPASATWDFKDGTPPATGPRVVHVFNTVGTFVGALRVGDRAGNLSDPRPFSVTVNAKLADVAAGGGGSVGAITGQSSAAFTIDRVKVRARYAQSKLKGSITLVGTSAQAGTLRADLRPATRGGKVRHLSGRVGLGAFSTTLTLPADLLPGSYKLDFVGPGGTLNSSLTLTAPREGVLRSGRVSASRRRALALFTLAAQPAKSLRGRLTVSWAQGSRTLGLVRVKSGARITAALPGGAALAKGKLRAQLRAGGIIVGDATTGVR